jgi:hypothetical protein
MAFRPKRLKEKLAWWSVTADCFLIALRRIKSGGD